VSDTFNGLIIRVTLGRDVLEYSVGIGRRSMKHLYILIFFIFVSSCSTSIAYNPQYFVKFEKDSTPLKKSKHCFVYKNKIESEFKKYYPQSDAGGYRHLLIDFGTTSNSILSTVLATYVYNEECKDTNKPATLADDYYKLVITKFTYTYQGVFSLVPYVEIDYTLLYIINHQHGVLKTTVSSNEKEGYGSANRASEHFEQIIHEILYLDLKRNIEKLHSR